MGLVDLLGRLVGRRGEAREAAGPPAATSVPGRRSPRPSFEPDQAMVAGVRRRADPRQLGVRTGPDSPRNLVALSPDSFNRLSRTGAHISTLPRPIGSLAGEAFETSLARVSGQSEGSYEDEQAEFRWRSGSPPPAQGRISWPPAAAGIPAAPMRRTEPTAPAGSSAGPGLSRTTPSPALRRSARIPRTAGETAPQARPPARDLSRT